MTPKLIIRQKITAFVNKYTVIKANPDGSASEAGWFVQQKRVAVREKVTFYRDEAHTIPAFTFRAEKILDVHGRYLVEDENGMCIGAFKKDFGASLTKSTWHILDKDGQNARYTVRESNATLAALRRFAGFVPVVGDIAEMMLVFFKYHFDVVDTNTHAIVGNHIKTTLFRDNYIFAMTNEAYSSVDERVWVAMTVALDALQSR